MHVFRAIVRAGALDFGSDFNLARFREWCRQHEGANLRIEEVKPLRSTSQNKYYWTYLDAVSRETGHTALELHEWAKRKFLPPRFVTVFGEEMQLPTSSASLKKHEFGEFLDRIAAETGVALPNPEDAGYINNY